MTQATEQQASRKRFSFGPVWSTAVIEGTAKDHEKLIAHGVKLKLGSKSSLKAYKFETLLGKVAAALKEQKDEDKGSKKTTDKAKEKSDDTVAA